MTAATLPFAEPAQRISPVTGLRNTFTLTWRSVLKIRTNMEDVVGLSLQPIMFLVLFTYVFGGAIAGGTHAYLQYALPGLLVMTVVFATLGTGLMLNQDIQGGVFDRFRTLPIARWAPLGGAVLGDMVRYLISVGITLGFGMILGFRIGTGPPVSSPRSAWVSAVIGLTRTNACSHPGMVCAGTSRLLPKTNGNIARNPYICTPWGVLTSIPMSADTQHMARANVSSSRQAAMADTGLVWIRKPSTIPNPRVIATEIM